jgi:hypothetical protein
MAAITYTTKVSNRTHLGGDRWLVTGTITIPGTDVDASGGTLYPIAQLDATTVDRMLVLGTSIIRTHAFWIKSTGKIAWFIEHGTTGDDAAVGAAAPGAQSAAFIAIIRKAA